MRAGRLDRQIGICKYGIVTNEGGDDVEGFAPALAVAAGIKHLPGAERLQSAENAAMAPTVFLIRWSPDLDPDAPTGINPKDRIEYPVASGRFLNVTSAIELGRRDTIEIAATGAAD
ncbi:head-tail adaptor protein [Sphingomonas sp. PB2P19]|uniref:head-tail adaptor protein n=1 Tax=Sphingomonas rhamnosi TaxID=3096156 RepID=UPI002FC6AB34